MLVRVALRRVGRCLCPLFLAGSWASRAEGQGRLWVLARVQALTHACPPQVLLAVRCYVIPEAVSLSRVHVCLCHVCLVCHVWLWGPVLLSTHSITAHCCVRRLWAAWGHCRFLQPLLLCASTR